MIEQLLNQVHEKKEEQAQKTQEEIRQFAGGLEDRSFASKIMKATEAIVTGLFPPEGSGFVYPAKLDESVTIIQEAHNASLDRVFLEFRLKWGITDVITSAQMRALFSGHRYGEQDLDDTGQIQRILADASSSYKTMAHDEAVQALSKIKYRNGLREAICVLADEQAMN